jgi:hypothetical protein
MNKKQTSLLIGIGAGLVALYFIFKKKPQEQISEIAEETMEPTKKVHKEKKPATGLSGAGEPNMQKTAEKKLHGLSVKREYASSSNVVVTGKIAAYMAVTVANWTGKGEEITGGTSTDGTFSITIEAMTGDTLRIIWKGGLVDHKVIV